jgi:hypothetical protein
VPLPSLLKTKAPLQFRRRCEPPRS